MRFKVSISRSILFLSFVTIWALLFSFQNCAPQLAENTMVEPEGATVNSTNSSLIPFAYDYEPDIISYMSCSKQNDKNSAGAQSTNRLDSRFYTFKVGAYDAGHGLKLRQEFIDYVTKTFTFKNILSDQQIRNAISYGEINKGSSLQLSLRYPTPISTNVFQLGSDANPPYLEAYNLFPSSSLLLSDSEFMPQLLQAFRDPTLTFTTLGTNQLQSYPLESVLKSFFNKNYDESMAQYLRDQLSDISSNMRPLLVTSYTDDATSQPFYNAKKAVSPLSNNLIWGSGFRLSFSGDGLGRGSNGAGKLATLSSLDELKLSDATQNSEIAQWTCDTTNYSLMIVSPADRVLCPVINPSSYNSDELARYEKMRKHLPESKWAILNVRVGCVVPLDKTRLDSGAIGDVSALPDCYGNRTFREVAYGAGENCVEGPKSDGQKSCPEFVSFCFKN